MSRRAGRETDWQPKHRKLAGGATYTGIPVRPSGGGEDERSPQESISGTVDVIGDVVSPKVAED